MATEAAYGAARERILHLCRGDIGSRELRIELLDALRRVVGFDAYVWLLTDPETSVGSSPVADVPFFPELSRGIRLKYTTAVNRWTNLQEPVQLLSVATRGDLHQSLMWRELLCHYGVTDGASAVFRDRFGCWSFLDLWRTEGRRPFQPADVELVATIAAPVTEALRHSQARTFAEHRDTPRVPPGPVVLLLSPDLAVRAQTPSAQVYLRALVPPAEGSAPVPAGAYNVAAQLLANEAGVDGNPPLARVHLADGVWLTMKAARLEGPRTDDGPDIAVSIEPSSASERASLFARAYGLTRRETELLTRLIAGADTRDLARLMYVSENTVQDHLKSVFAKTGTRSRRTLLSLVLGR